MRIDKKCTICGTPFVAIKTNQFFCSRKCFKKSYNIRKREERRHNRATNPAPHGYYVCSWCSERTAIPFSIKRFKQKWDAFVCPHCNVPRLEDPMNPRGIWFWEESNYRGPLGVASMVSSITIAVSTFISSTVFSNQQSSRH